MEEHKNTINTFPKEEISNTEQDNSSDEQSSKNFDIDVLNTCNQTGKSKLERGMFLNKIRELSPICISELARELKCSRSKLYYVLRDFEFAGLVETKIILDGNTAKRIVVIPDYKKLRLELENDN